MPTPEHESRATVEITRIVEKNRTIRWAVVGAVVVLCVWLISDATVKIVNRPEPPWLTIVLAILAAIGIGGSPVLLVLKIARARIAEYSERKVELERTVDPDRSSSGLRQDGTHPND